MFSLEQRKIALETYIKYDHSYTATVVELGYPAKETMRKWWKEYKATGEIPVGKTHRKSKYSDEQAQAAVNHYLEHGKSLTRTMKALGYPRGRETLCGWIDELAPDERKKRGPNHKRNPDPIEKRIQAVADLEARHGPATEVDVKKGV